MRNTNSNGTLDAYNVRGDEVKPLDHYGYKIIAVVQSEHFWAAYMGFTDWDDYRVAAEGDKLPYETAKRLFSTIDAVIPNYNH